MGDFVVEVGFSQVLFNSDFVCVCSFISLSMGTAKLCNEEMPLIWADNYGFTTVVAPLEADVSEHNIIFHGVG